MFNRYASLGLLIILLLILGLAWLLMRTADEQNEASVRSEQNLVQALLDASRQQLPANISDYARWGDMYSRVGVAQPPDLAWFDANTTETLYTNFKIDLVILTEGHTRALRVMDKGKWIAANGLDIEQMPEWHALVTEALAAPAGQSAVRDIPWKGQYYWAVAQRLQAEEAETPGQASPKSNRVLIFGRSLSADRILGLVKSQGLVDLAIQPDPKPAAANVALIESGKAGYLSWLPHQAGTAFIRSVRIPAGLLIALTLVLCYVLTRDARQRHLDLMAEELRQAGHRRATVALVNLLYTQRFGDEATELAMWREFATILQEALAAERIALLSFQADDPGYRYLVTQGDINGPMDRPSGELELLAREYLLLRDAPGISASAAMVRDGKLVGELQVQRSAPNRWRKDEGNFLVAVAALASLALESSVRRGAERSLHRRLHFDPLTELPNTLYAGGDEPALPVNPLGGWIVAVLRIDGLEDVNVLYGRESGDALLIKLAERLVDSLLADEQVARSGGKRFDLSLHTGAGKSSHERLEQLIMALTQPMLLNGHTYRPQCRVGAVLCDAETLGPERLQEASLALDYAQQVGREKIIWYDQGLRTLTERRVALAQALRHTLVNGGFALAYQPFVVAETGIPAGAEVLLRWTHPDFGPVSPAEFVPIAEEGGMIVELGAWVIDTAFAQLHQWNSRFPNKLKLAINLSPRQLEEENLALQIFTAMARHDIDRSAVEFEVTESLALEPSPAFRANLQAFRAAEIDIAIDDFGTGYATFSFLRRYEVQKIKLDKMFIDELNTTSARQLVQSMITMSSGLGARVTAEGVETEWQKDQLIALGCDYIQGYFFARPMAVADFEGWLRQFS